MLLSSHGNHKVFLRGRSQLTNEDAINLYQAQQLRDGREHVAERQPLLGQTCLHRRSSDFASKLQRTVRPEEVVVTTENLEMIIHNRCFRRA